MEKITILEKYFVLNTMILMIVSFYFALRIISGDIYLIAVIIILIMIILFDFSFYLMANKILKSY